MLLICECVLCDLMGKFELCGGMFLDWVGRGELQMEHGMGSGKEGGEKCRGTSLREQSGGY